jgi:uncharacterized protein YndB with AHSA1/START domain
VSAEDGGAGSQPGAAVRVTTTVAVDPATAFAVFTDEIDLWWRRGPRYRFRAGQAGRLVFEPGAGGRLVERDEAGGEYEVGRVRVWEPSRRLVFGWRGIDFAPGEETEVEVRFERVAAGTRVTLEHRGWDALRADHPARHGLAGTALASRVGLWWGDQLNALRARAAAGRAPS